MKITKRKNLFILDQRFPTWLKIMNIVVARATPMFKITLNMAVAVFQGLMKLDELVLLLPK